MKVGKINNKELMLMFGTEKNIGTYEKLKKISNSTKKALLNKAKLKCDIIDLGNGIYEIKEIYEKPISRSIFTIQDSDVYSTIAPIIISKLIDSRNNNENVLNISLINYYHLMEVVNKKNYNNIKYNKDEAIKNFDLDLKNMESFFTITNEKLRYYLEGCLDLLKRSGTIIWQKVIGIKIRHVALTNTHEKVKTSIMSEYRRATEEEIRFVEDCKAKICKEFNLSNRSMIPFNYYANTKYHEMLIKENIVYDYSMYEVYYTDIDKSFEFMSLFNNFNLLKYSKKFSEFIISNIESSYNDRNKNNDIIKKELDYLFLSNNTLRHDSDDLIIDTMKINTYGEYNRHVVESCE